MKASLILGLALLLQDAPATLTFLPPKDSKPADVERAAKVIEKRCTEFGYKGVRAKVIDGAVEVTCETGITAAMRPHIDRMAMKGFRFEFRVKVILGERQIEQYQPGKGAPKGAEWVRDARADMEVWHLFWSEPRIPISGRVTWVDRRGVIRDRPVGYWGPTEKFFEFDKGLTEWYRKLSDKHAKGVCLLVDGAVVFDNSHPAIYQTEEESDILTRLEASTLAKQNPTLPFRINSPLPFPLELKK